MDTGPRVHGQEEQKVKWGRVGGGGAGVFSLFERHWEEVKNTEQINNASQLQFRNANQVAASKTHYR